METTKKLKLNTEEVSVEYKRSICDVCDNHEVLFVVNGVGGYVHICDSCIGLLQTLKKNGVGFKELVNSMSTEQMYQGLEFANIEQVDNLHLMTRVVLNKHVREFEGK